MGRWITRALVAIAFAMSALMPSLALAAQPRVVLITSLNFDSMNALPDFKAQFASYPLKLERVFLQALEGEGYDLEVVHYADAAKVHEILMSGENVAVFYVAHAGYTPLSSTITDYALRDIGDVFTEVHPNLRYLGIIGCHSRQILDQLRRSGAFADRPNLILDGFDTVIDARAALAEAIRRSLPKIRKLDAPSPSSCAPEPSVRLRITRKLPALCTEGPPAPVMLSLGPELLTTFPRARPGETQVQEITVPASRLARASTLKLVARTGASPMAEIPGELGDFEIEGSWSGARWVPFALHGKPIGATSHVYLYRGTLPATFSPGSAFGCVPLQQPVPETSPFDNSEW